MNVEVMIAELENYFKMPADDGNSLMVAIRNEKAQQLASLKKQRIHQLVILIKAANDLYWHGIESDVFPPISDEEYDKLVRRLAELDPDNELLTEIHSASVSSDGKVHHEIEMLSLNKAYSFAELISFFSKIVRSNDERILIQPKYDGVSADKSGNVLSTRGDGAIGEDISLNLKDMDLSLTDGDCRGEILIPNDTWDQIKDTLTRKNGETYRNSRNAVGGILKREDNSEATKVLMLVPFDESSFRMTFERFSEMTTIEWDEFVEHYKQHEFPTDGIVFKLEDQEYADSLGSTSHHRKSEIAFKFSNPTGQTLLEGIEWSVGKKAITPIGKVSPVEISGVTVQNVNLHNIQYVQDNDIHIGDNLVVERAGDVIPDFQSLIPGDERTEILLERCPACNHRVTRNGPVYICDNDDCAGKHITKLVDSVVRLGIEGLGEPTLKKMVSKGVSNMIDIFNLTVEEIESLDGFASRSAHKLWTEIQRVRTEGVFSWQILASLNLEGIGRTLSKQLLKDKTILDLFATTASELMNMNGIGPERAEVLVEGLEKNSEYISALLGLVPINIQVKSGPKLKVCFTGKFPEKKSVYYDLLNESEFEVVNSVSKTTDLVVVADPSKNSNKQQKAEKLGIKVVAVDELMEKVGGML